MIAGQIVAKEYFPGLFGDKNDNTDLIYTLPDSLDLDSIGQANVLGAENSSDHNYLGNDVDYSQIMETDTGNLPFTDLNTGDLNTYDLPIEDLSIDNSNTTDMAITDVTLTEETPTTDVNDFENEGSSQNYADIYLRKEQIDAAGFVNAYIEKEQSNEMLFKTIFTGDLSDTKVDKNVIRTADSLLAKVYVISTGPSNSITDIFDILKVRASEGLDIEINETNEFGDASFYMNDLRRSNTAFLTVRFGQLIYGFSYPKDYHPQIRNLIALLDMEF